MELPEAREIFEDALRQDGSSAPPDWWPVGFVHATARMLLHLEELSEETRATDERWGS